MIGYARHVGPFVLYVREHLLLLREKFVFVQRFDDALDQRAKLPREYVLELGDEF